MLLMPIVHRLDAIDIVKGCKGYVALLNWDNGLNVVPVKRTDTLSEMKRFFSIDTSPKRKGALKAIEASAKREDERREVIAKKRGGTK